MSTGPMPESRYTLEGIEIKRPSTFKIERYKLTNATRLANGDMAADVINHKKKFTMQYKAIQATDLNKILDILWDNDDYFFNFTYVENGVVQTCVVYPGNIPSTLHRSDGNWVWKDVSFSLIER